MKLKRTANAGVLLELDGVSILLDGVCREVPPYPATPSEERQRLLTRMPDIVAFTHCHKDHYDPAYAAEYMRQTGRAIFAPEGVRGATMNACSEKGVELIPVPTRHIGAVGKDMPHTGFVIKGSKCIWFTGDSAPSQWKDRLDLPNPDVMIVPYAYLNTKTSWAFTKSKKAVVVLVHMPARDLDPAGLWAAVDDTVGDLRSVFIPDISETIVIE